MKEETHRRVPWLVLALVLVAAVCALLLVYPRVESTAQGGTITVSTTADEYNHPGPDSGCSLREAIQAVNGNGSFGGCTNESGTADTIIVPAGIYTLTRLAGGVYWTNDKGSLNPKDVSVDIQGAGPDSTIITTTAAWDDRVFFFSSNSDQMQGGLQGVTLQGGNSSLEGGGLYVDWPHNTLGSTFVLSDVILRDNLATSGGGVSFSYGPAIVVQNVTVSDNEADDGGGMFIRTRYITGSVRIVNSTISGNKAQNSGGGLYVSYHTVSPTVLATNVTFYANKAEKGSGGNIYNQESDLHLRNCIVAMGTDSGGDNNCAGNPAGNITSLGYNIETTNTCGFDASGDLTGTNPSLDPLSDYGGGTSTHRLQPDSPAVNHIPQGTNGCGTLVAEDQRGMPRPQLTGGACDAGAYELAYPDLSVVKSAVPEDYLTYHDELTYTIVLSNAGLGEADSVAVTDALPAEVAFDRWVIQPLGASVDETGEMAWTGDLPAGKALTFTLVVSHVGASEGTLENTAEFDHWSDSGADTVTNTVVGAPSLGLTKSTIPHERMPPSSTVTYTLALANTGLADAHDVVLRDPLPITLTFVAWVPGGRPPGATITANELTWTGTVTGSDAITFAFVVTNTGAEGEVVTNKAGYTYGGVTGTAETSIWVKTTWMVYLPVVLR